MTYRLVQRLRRGAQDDDAALAEGLGLTGPIDDRRLAAALFEALAADELAPLASFSTARGTSAGSVPAPSSELPRDAHGLAGVLRSGTVAERRSAARSVATLLRGEDAARGEPTGEDIALLADAIEASRDLEAGYELLLARRALPGALGQEARADDATAAALWARLDARVRGFWEGEVSEEPFTTLAAEELAVLSPRLREASDPVVAHLGALIEGADGALDVPARRALVGAFRYSGDPRLIGSLGLVLASKDRVLTTGAARALARIDDPRVRPILVRAYRSAVRPAERAVVAGALGLCGDPMGRGWVRALLSNADAPTLRAALEAMATLGQPEDVDRLAPFAAHEDVVVASRAVRALGRTGDQRALRALARVRSAAMDGALRVEVEDAEAAVIARLELRGEAVPRRDGPELTGAHAIEPAGEAEGGWQRVRAWGDWMIARLYLAVGMHTRALRRLERAAARRPRWAAPWVTMGEAFTIGQSAQALPALRRALEADRSWVERHAARLLARVFLRRAEETAKGGRPDVARSLLEEALRLDLRRAPTSLRFEMQRRLGALRGEGG